MNALKNEREKLRKIVEVGVEKLYRRVLRKKTVRLCIYI
jgi:hypothetical protein